MHFNISFFILLESDMHSFIYILFFSKSEIQLFISFSNCSILSLLISSVFKSLYKDLYLYIKPSLSEISDI